MSSCCRVTPADHQWWRPGRGPVPRRGAAAAADAAAAFCFELLDAYSGVLAPAPSARLLAGSAANLWGERRPVADDDAATMRTATPFMDLVSQAMARLEYKDAPQVFVIVDNGSDAALRAFVSRYNQIARPFDWKFTTELREFMDRISKHQQQDPQPATLPEAARRTPARITASTT